MILEQGPCRVKPAWPVIACLLIVILFPISARCEDEFYIRIGIEEFWISQFDTVPIIMEQGSLYVGEFDFLIWYDSSIIELTDVFGGEELYSTTNGCGWRELSFQDASELLNPNDSGSLVRIKGRVGTGNCIEDYQCFLPKILPAKLVNLVFKLDDRTHIRNEAAISPLMFYWSDCADNTLLSPTGNTLYAVDTVAGLYMTLYMNRVTIPSIAPEFNDDCFGVLGEKQELSVSRNVFFRHGYIHNGFDYIESWGDINLNELVFEPSDYYLFRDYFLHGMSVFQLLVDGQVAASDVNRDGVSLTLEDFVLLARSVVGDTIPYYDLPACRDSVRLELNYSTLSLDFDSQDSLGALLLIIQGKIDPRIWYPQMMELDYHTANDTTRVLVHRLAGGRAIQQGTVITGVRGQLISAQAATYHGARVECVIGK